MAFKSISGEVVIVKKVGSPWDLFDSKKFDSEMLYSHNILLGHNRYATTGKINSVNAHPFECGSIIGAHNGTLNTKHLLADSQDYDVDSENLFHNMDVHGVEDTSAKMGGAYALTWIDEEDGSINFLRNKDRPLHYVHTLDGKTIFWASEVWMLYSILDRHGIKHGEAKMFEVHKQYSLAIDDVYPAHATKLAEFLITDIPAYQVYKNPPVGLRLADKKEKEILSNNVEVARKYRAYIGKMIDFQVTGSTTSVQESFITGTLITSIPSVEIKVRVYAPVDSELWNQLSGSPKDFTGKVKSMSCMKGGYCLMDIRTVEEVYDDVILETMEGDFYEEPSYHTYNGKLLTHNEWSLATSKGCAWCGESPLESEEDELVWIDSSEFMCAHCASQDEAKEMCNI